jgi:hypothetical protein
VRGMDGATVCNTVLIIPAHHTLCLLAF